MAEWKKILLAGDAAELSDLTPASVGTTAAAGVGAVASRNDHVHDIGVGAIDASNLFAASVVDNAAMADDAIDSAEIADGAIDAVHLAADIIDGTKIADNAIGNEHLGDDCVKAAEIDEAATDIQLSQVILTPKADATGTVEGTIFYDSDENHLYVYVV